MNDLINGITTHLINKFKILFPIVPDLIKLSGFEI